MIDQTTETLLSIADAARWLQRHGRRASRPAVWRWARRGLIAADGTRVYLEFIRIERQVQTSAQALRRLLSTLDRIAADQRCRGRPAGL
jgi:hypothetical protein